MIEPNELAEIRSHLEREYAGVYGPAEIDFHLSAHVGDAFAGHACQVVAPGTKPGGRILDVGAGYGSFVIMARARGFDAIGTEIAPFEIACARRRLARERPADDPARTFLDRGIFNSALDNERFDAITFWNVLEHIEDIDSVIRRAASLLVPGGAIYIICPSYKAWRNEAHYQIPWTPFLTREDAIRRIKEHGKDPRFFETSVFMRTNWEVMSVLRKHGLRLFDRMNSAPMHLGRLLLEPRQFLDYFNPFRAAVELAAQKPR